MTSTLNSIDCFKWFKNLITGSFGNLPFNYEVRKLNGNYVIKFTRELKRVLSYSFTYNNQTIVLEGDIIDSSDYYRVKYNFSYYFIKVIMINCILKGK